MFIELHSEFADPNKTNNPGAVFDLHPIQLSGYLDAVWEAWRQLLRITPAIPTLSPTSPNGFHPAIPKVLVRTDGPTSVTVSFEPPLQGVLTTGVLVDPAQVVSVAKAVIERSLLPVGDPRGELAPRTLPPWSHLIYAYLLENTRALDIFEKLVADATSDETFGALSERSHRWLRTTEELFLRTSSSYFMAPVMSRARTDTQATRRNAYQRMFGMDLNHGAADGGPYRYPRAQTSNMEFVKTLQDLLREIWRGYINARNESGPNTTDDSNISELIERLKTQLNARRFSAGGSGPFAHGNLLREEFDAVATLSWFALALDDASPLISDLKANGTSREEKLTRLGERTKIAAHAKSRSLFILADELPALLRRIELGVFDGGATGVLYKDDTPLRQSILKIINHWSIATGVDLKSVAVSPGAR